MTTDLLRRLYAHADSFNGAGVRDNPDAWPDLYREAAREIERLQELLPEIRVQLNRHITMCIVHSEETMLRDAQLFLRQVKAEIPDVEEERAAEAAERTGE